MLTQNHPHINDDVLKALDDCNLIYLDKNDEDACSFVVRLAPTVVNSESLPLRFEKRAKPNRDGILDTQVINEGDIFNRMRTLGINIDKIVNRLKYSQESNGNYVLVTESVGLDADRWQSIPLYFNGGLYQHIFCHPLVLLHFIKGTILGLKSIHQHKLYHCDIRADQICIPFTKNEKNITVNPDEIKLIDFGIAIYKMNPVITHNPVRFNSKNMPEGDYVATSLIKAGDHQRHLYQTTGEYNFNQLINQIDCAVDLYSLGFLLNSLEIKKLSSDIKLWNSFEQEYLQWLKELLSLSDKTTPFKEKLPHDQYIRQVNQWIKNVQQLSGLTIDQLVFGLENTKPIPYKPTGTPTPSHEGDDANVIGINNQKKLNKNIDTNIDNSNEEFNKHSRNNTDINEIGVVPEHKTHKSNNLLGRIIALSVIVAVLMMVGYLFLFKNNYQTIPSSNSTLDHEPTSEIKPELSLEAVDDNKAIKTALTIESSPTIESDDLNDDKNTENIAIDFEHNNTTNTSNELTKTKRGNKYGFVDQDGNEIIGFYYSDARDFSEGLARVKKNGKWGFIDKTGQTVIDFEYDDAWSFSEDLGSVKKNGKWGFIDKTGQTVIDFEYDDARRFEDLQGLARVKKNGKWGFIDKTGQTVIDFEYDDARNFSKGLARVKQNNKWSHINKTGQMVILESDY